MPETYDDAITQSRALFEDLTYTYPREWKAKADTRRLIGYLPIYIPREIIHALDMLPVGLFGAGDRLPVVRGDAFFQSYICHLPRTVIELALNGNLDDFDGFIFPSICDVIRNLSGIFRMKMGDRYVRYLDFPQNFNPEVGGTYYRSELERLIDDLSKLNGVVLTNSALNKAIHLYNRNRNLLQRLDSIRVDRPHVVSATDFYLIRRAGQILEVEECNRFWQRVIDLADSIVREPEDKIRVVVSGSFCEQPPLGLIKTIENAGCYIVEDDFQLGLNWFRHELPADTDDPLGVLVDAYLNHSPASSAVYTTEEARGKALLSQVQEQKADGVIFCAPSFCDPALLDRPALEQSMDQNHIKHFSFQYHENLGQFHVIKEQAGTFADMVKLWE
ncbi:MAG: benzoyl-CoA reductase subunit C [FCB group bacterium]|nr:benzoyl-CoA reductase subunit C [FCB group bacterium]